MHFREEYGMERGYRAEAAQPSGFKTRRVEAGWISRCCAGRIGLGCRFPPQFGQMPCNRLIAQPSQNVHSKVQTIASADSGGKSLSQHSQLGRSSSKWCSEKQKKPTRWAVGNAPVNPS
jgi:hypothetical protein